MTKYNKLVRDKIPEILEEKGILYEKRIASDDEFKVELIKKLDEEVKEFLNENITEELADIRSSKDRSCYKLTTKNFLTKKF